MKLSTRCSDCGKSITREVAKCPTCGRRILLPWEDQVEPPQKVNLTPFIVVGAIALLGLLIAIDISI